MRMRGEKRKRAAVVAEEPLEAWLHVCTEPWRPHWLPHRDLEPTTIARLTDWHDSDRSLFPELHGARLRELEGAQFVIVGLEMLTECDNPAQFPQAWWCRVGRT
jgi:hypothetical protein